MLSGPEASPNSPLAAAAEASGLLDLKTAQDGLAHWAGQVKLYSRASLAAMAMAGLHLRALRTIYFGERSPKGGRPKKPDTVSGFPTWESLLADVAGVTERTAQRWMKVADGIEAIAEREGSDVITICQKLPWEWTPEEAERIGSTAQELTENRTLKEFIQTDFLSSLGYVNKQDVHGTNNPTGKNGGKRKPQSMEQMLEDRRHAARKEFFGCGDIPHRPQFGSPAGWMRQFTNQVHSAKTPGDEEDTYLQSLPVQELRRIWENHIKPFIDAWKELEKRSNR